MVKCLRCCIRGSSGLGSCLLPPLSSFYTGRLIVLGGGVVELRCCTWDQGAAAGLNDGLGGCLPFPLSSVLHHRA